MHLVASFASCAASVASYSVLRPAAGSFLVHTMVGKVVARSRQLKGNLPHGQLVVIMADTRPRRDCNHSIQVKDWNL